MLFFFKLCKKGISFLSPICPSMISLIVLKKKKIKRIRKIKKNQNVFTWLQVCLLGDVRVIWCNSLGDRHFQTNVIDNVENLFNFYLLITYFLFCILTSCTHYTQIFAKSSTWECVCYLIWPSFITYGVIFDTLFSNRVEFEEKCLKVVKSSDFYFQFVTSLKIWEQKVFKIFWECSCEIHIIKIAFQFFFYKTSRILQNFKIFHWFDWSKLIFARSKMFNF